MTDDSDDHERLKLRETQAWDAFYQLCSRSTYRVLYCITGGPPHVLEELNQEVWLTAIQIIDRLDVTRGTPRSWILGIARLKGLSYLRTQYKNRLVYVGEPIDLANLLEDCSADSPANDKLPLLRAAIVSLPERWQFVLRQKYDEGRTVEDIAELADSTPKAIESTLSRARQRLREIIAATNEGKAQP